MHSLKSGAGLVLRPRGASHGTPPRRRGGDPARRPARRARQGSPHMRVVMAVLLVAAVPAFGQAQVLETVTFEEAVQRAVKNHPTVQQAAAGILQAEAILQQVRSRYLPSVDATFSTNVIDPVTEFSGSSINPRTQTVTTAGVSVPLFMPVRWAERNQAED